MSIIAWLVTIASFFIRGNKPKVRDYSPTYKFGPWENTAERDIPVPIIYGRNKVAGNIIYRTPQERKDIFEFVALGEGEVNDIYNIKVNDIPIENLSNCSYNVYYGTPTQNADTRVAEETITIEANADSFCCSDYPDQNFGDKEVFMVDTNSYAFIKFDISTFYAASIIEAKLYLDWGGVYIDPVDISFYKISDDNWSESTITWNNKPAFGDLITTVLSVNDDVVVDITQFIQEEYFQGNKIVTIGIQASGPQSFDSKEFHANTGPYIRITYNPGLLPFRNTAYIALTLQAMQELSGGTPTVTSVVEGLKILPIGGGIKTYSNNPARCIYDLLTNTRYGLGIPVLKIDTASFQEAEAYCDELVSDGKGGQEKRFELDIVLDEKEPALDSLNDILATFAGYLYFLGGKIKLGVEKEKDPVQSFDMDTIAEGSFSYEEVPQDELPNRVKVLFTDADDDWNKTYVVAEDRISIEDEGEVREEEIALYGINRKSQASRMAMQYLWKARLCRTTCSFRVGINALQCEVGDVIQISHDVPGWTNKLFMIEQIKETETDEMELVCREYNSSIYNDEGLPYQDDEGHPLPNPWAPPDPVRNLTLEEASYFNQDGVFIPRIFVSFDEPFENAFWHHAEIWTSLDGSDWKFYGICEHGDDYPITGVFQIGDTLYVKVVSVSVNGVKDDFASSPYASIDVQQTVANPPDVTGLQIDGQGNDTHFYGKDCKFVWNRVSATAGADQVPVGSEVWGAVEGTDDPYFKDFYLEIWVEGKKARSEVVTDNWYVYTYEKNTEDNGTAKPTFTIKVWARNNYNQLSSSPAVLTVTNPAPDPVSNLSATAGRIRVELTWDNPSGVANEDIESILIYRNTSDSIPASPFVSLSKDREFWTDVNIAVGQKYYYWIKVKDAFGQLSSAVGSVNATPTGLEIADYDLSTHLIQNLDFSNNSPSSGYVSWTECKIAYKGSTYTISSGNTNKKYIWWDKDNPTTFQTQDTRPSLVVGEDLLVCYNDGGTANPVFQRMLLFGALIQANTILSDNIAANQIKAGHIAFDLDDVPDGTYGKVLKTDIYAGHIRLSETVGNLDDISDGSTYGKILKTSISSGRIKLSETVGDLDDIEDGTTYGKVSKTDISAGRIQLSYDGGKMVLGKDTFGTGLEGIKINDGTYDRVKIGELSTGNYGIQVYDSDNNLIFDSAGSSTPALAGWSLNADEFYKGNIKLSAANERLEVVDSQATPQTRVLVGKLGTADTDYGIRIYDSSGKIVVNLDGLGEATVGGDQLVADLILGTKIRTDSEGARIEIDGSIETPEIKVFNASEVQTVSIKSDGSGFFGSGDGKISWDTSGNMSVQGSLSVLNANIGTITAGKFSLDSGKVQVGADVLGSGQHGIKVSDGTYNRVEIGNLGSDYGVTIRDDSGKVVMSATGLGLEVVDTAQIINGAVTAKSVAYADASSAVTTTSTSWVFMPNMELTVDVEEGAKVLILFNATANVNASGKWPGYTRIVMDYNPIPSTYSYNYIDPDDNKVISHVVSISPAAGSHLFQVQWKIDPYASSMSASNRSLCVIVFKR